MFYTPCRLTTVRIKPCFSTNYTLFCNRNAIIAYEGTADREMQWL